MHTFYHVLDDIIIKMGQNNYKWLYFLTIIIIIHSLPPFHCRAVYRKADVYILDDPLSAVDAVVGRRLFQTCMSGVLKNSIVVLVTHHLQYAQLTDAMLVVDKVH